jgi:hypothetical protein
MKLRKFSDKVEMTSHQLTQLMSTLTSGLLLTTCFSASHIQQVAAAPGLLPDTDLDLDLNLGGTSCRCFPGDKCWPKKAEWDAFNKTVGGRLIATVPIAAPCHFDNFAAYDAGTCQYLQDNWFHPETHIASSSSTQAPFFMNNSCNPFLPPNTPCTLGNYVQYSVDARSAADYQNTIKFVKKNNIRLVIRNTGHDYIGKSTGAGAVAIWTNHLKSIELKDYTSTNYTGKAAKLGAGVSVEEAYQFADRNGLIAVGGNCPTVGISGGYTQGGGHGPLISKFGMAVDQVLEWEVVTSTGLLVTATPDHNADLFWALTGGGGGTYGAVVSMTVKLHRAMPVAAANMTVVNSGLNQDQFWDVYSTFQNSLPPMVDAGIVAIFLLSPQFFLLSPVVAPGVNKTTLDSFLQPTINKLKQYSIPYQYYSNDFPSFYTEYKQMNQPFDVANYQLGGRLIPRSLVNTNNNGLASAIRSIIESGTLFSGQAFNVKKFNKPDAIGLNPYWRDSIFDAVVGLPFNYTDQAVNIENQKRMTNELLPKLEALTPNGGAYLNEADFNQPGFKEVFYGSHYPALDAIKRKYDPDDTFYALTAVGSDRWRQNLDGRLCRAYS